MKILIRYLEIYMYIQDLRICDIIKNSIQLQQQQTEYLFSINHTVTVPFALTCTARNSAFWHSSSACRFLSFQHLKPQGPWYSARVFGIIITFPAYTFQTYEHPS